MDRLDELTDFCHLGRRLVHLSKSIGNFGLDSLRPLVESHDLRRRLWLTAIQPIKKVYQHSQTFPLRVLHRFPQFRPRFLPNRVVFELEEILLERNWVVEEESWRVFENLWDSVLTEVEREACRGIGEQEGNIIGQGFWEEGRQNRQSVVCADSDAWDGTIGQDENGINSGNVFLNMSRNALLVELVLLKTASIRQSRRVEDANLHKSYALITLKNTGTHRYAVLTCKFVDMGRVGLTLAARTTLLIAVVEDSEVVIVNIFAEKDICNEF